MIASDPRSEPFDPTRLVAERDQPHMRSAIDERYQYPAYGGQAQVGNTNLNLGWLSHIQGRLPTRICRD